jgi:hypothetical protein
MARLKVLRITRRAKNAVADIDYADKLSTEERVWMEIFVAANYSNDTDALDLLATGPKQRKSWAKSVSAANHAFGRDLSNKHTKLRFPVDGAEDEGAEETDAALTRSSNNFKFYKCARCLKRGDDCRCPTKRAQPYGREDYMLAETSVEDAYSEADAALNEKAYDLLPYGTNPQDLKVGHKVVICLPHHYLKDRTGTVKEFRKLTGEYLIAADRAGLKHRDGSQSTVTLCWVRPEGLKRAKLSRV